MSILTKLQIALLKAVGSSKLGKQYIWTGGTALAHRLHHRYSSDLDFFSETLDAPEIFLSDIARVWKQLSLAQTSYEERMNRRLFILTNKTDDIRVEFVYFPFSPLKKPMKDTKLGIRIDSVIDIAVNKTLSAYQRREPKDAYDLYRLCKYEKYDLKKLTRLAEKKFGVAVDYTSLIAKLVTITETIDSLAPLLIHSEDNLKKKMHEFFQSTGNKFLMSILF